MKKIYIGFAFAHHKNSQGGYHHIKEYLKYDTIIDAQWEKEFYECTSTNLFFKAFRKIYILILGKGTPLTVIRCILLSLFRKNQVFHFIYAENSYKWLHHFIGKSNKIVCTFHQPAEYFTISKKWIGLLKRLDKIILVTQKDVKQFEQWTGKQNVYYVPHGVNTDFFKYNPDKKREKSILMVGNWLRDFPLARDFFISLNKKMPEVKIRVVTQIDNHHYFENIQCSLYRGISDEELRDYYQISSIVLFPLKQYTANNAMLEAASCGCSILVATNQLDIHDNYFSKEYINIVDPTVQAIEVMISKNFERNQAFNAKKLSDFVNKNYSWNAIANQTDEILK